MITNHLRLISLYAVMLLIASDAVSNQYERRADATSFENHTMIARDAVSEMNVGNHAHWQELHSGLWQSDTRLKERNIGFPVAVLNPKTLDFSQVYLTHVSTENDIKPMKHIIDFDSFHQLASSTYYKDKNHIYRFVTMAGGGTFSIFSTKGKATDVDYASFEILNDCYPKDNTQIFHWRDTHYSHDYDYASFQTCIYCGCMAKDKNTYYVVGEELKQREIDKLINDPKINEETRKALVFLNNTNKIR